MNKLCFLSNVCVCVLTLFAATAQAALITPAGLNAGDKYHVIFVSSTTMDATSSNIADYDTHVQSAANSEVCSTLVSRH